jgi:hypothetical protein
MTASWGWLRMEDVGRSGGNIDQAVRRTTTAAWLFTTAWGRFRRGDLEGCAAGRRG